MMWRGLQFIMGKKELEEIQNLRKQIRVLTKPVGETAVGKRSPGRDRGAMFQALLDAYPDHALLIDGAGVLIACNKTARQRLGKKINLAAKHTIFDIFPNYNPKEWEKYFLHFRERKKSLSFEKVIDGIYYQHHLYPVLSARGSIRFIVVLVQDVTDYRLTLNALASSEEKYRTLIENISDIIYAVNENGFVVYVNPAVERFLGYTTEEVKGVLFRKFLYRDDIRLVLNDFEGFLAGTVKQKEYRFRHKDGSIRWGRVSSHPIMYKNAIIGFQGVIADITQAKSFSMNLIQAAQENILRSLANSFTAALAAPIRRARDVLLQHPSFRIEDAGVDLQIREMMHDLEGISLYLKNYSVFTAPDRGVIREVDINTLIENGLALLKNELVTEQIRLECSLARNLSPVLVNPLSFIQVFINILAHSLQTLREEAVPEKKIAVATGMEKDKVAFSIHDNSKGISDEVLAHIAHPFYAQGEGKRAGVFQVVSGRNALGLHVKILLPAVIQTL
jgi:PAS domain S-box-containing protein